jgi:hypothetical protein
MQKTIPAHLSSTYKLIECSFPQGITEEMYLPLLSILYKHMSDRSLAQIVADFMGKDYHQVLNDIYHIGSLEGYSSESTSSLLERLGQCGYEKWLNEE